MLDEAQAETADPWTREDTIVLSAIVFVAFMILFIGMALGAAL